jgi:outer membrane phospholipase A
MKKTTTRQNIKSKDTKKNKRLNEKEKSKKEEEKIDPNGFIATYAISAYHHYRCEFETRFDGVLDTT